ncbi:sugar-transfer associated ATP-grasp domain-containing protein [Schumannella sp. 10F1B-5-1]|uniref:sugar-transfer associated ATP-grasp domain-containing protein n=1 Tax=Schumannella sp. 10F1B-5-1 TaxID=2590780 RepID=UPI00113045D3|nr:sugar-transfer associated ATP-grasp domain-containing protein [Schumannella sp. 10F1B-5-1]TPW70870.1 hexapeptide transferase [Schumannella sp. 10F1B-5-1]
MLLRLRYLLNRARRLSPANLLGFAGRIAAGSGRSRLGILIDMLWCSVRYETAFQDYADWDFHLLTGAERRTYMTHPKSNHLVERYNAKEFRHTFRDKVEFNAAFAPHIGRDWLDVRESTPEQLQAFGAKHGRIMAKVPDSLSGLGIKSHRADEISDWAAFRETLLAGRQFLLEEFITQHPDMASLEPTSVNSLRMITFAEKGKVTVLAAVLKMGNGGDVDNFSGGGMYTMLNEQGVAEHPAFDAAGGTFAVHPRSGTSIVGFQVPLYAETLALLDEVAGQVPEMPYIGWDVAIGPDRPMLIEGNPNSGVYQLKPSLSGVRTGLLPRYREVMHF